MPDEQLVIDGSELIGEVDRASDSRRSPLADATRGPDIILHTAWERPFISLPGPTDRTIGLSLCGPMGVEARVVKPRPERTADQSIRVSSTSAGTVVTVTRWVAQNLQVDSCNVWTPEKQPPWTKATRDAVNRAMADRGKAKGRVLYARALPFPGSVVDVVAVATLHLDDSDVWVLHIGHSEAINVMQRDFATKVLLKCAERTAERHGCDSLCVLLHTEEDIRRYCSDHGFKRLGRRDHRVKALRQNEYLAQRPVKRA